MESEPAGLIIMKARESYASGTEIAQRIVLNNVHQNDVFILPGAVCASERCLSGYAYIVKGAGVLMPKCANGTWRDFFFASGYRAVGNM